MRIAIVSRCIEFVLFVLITIPLFVGCAVAGEQRGSVWIGAGFGVSWHAAGHKDDLQDPGSNLRLTLQRGIVLLGARTAINGEASLYDNHDAYSDIALLIGVAKVSRRHVLSLAAGPALVSGHTIRTTYVDTGDKWYLYSGVDKKYGKKPVGGFALEGQLFFKPIRMLGIGIYAYGDINHERSFCGVTLSIIGGYFPSPGN